MRRWRDIGLLAALFGLLIVFTVYGPGRGQPEKLGQSGSVHSSDDDGALALQRWLDTLGYRTANIEYSDWQVPNDAQVLWIINPVKTPMIEADAQEVLRWVRAGGTLIAVDERPQQILSPNGLWRVLNATTTVSDTLSIPAERATAPQPVLFSPPVTSVPVNTVGALGLKDPGFVTLLQTRFGPTLIGRQEGRGYLYLAVTAYPFTNEGLREPGSAALVLNLLSRAPQGARVLFDEYHHGFGRDTAAAPPSLRRIVLSQWWGWAAVYATLVVTAYIVLTGRRFGRPVPLARDVARRSSAEYVQSLAQLMRRGRKSADIARHYHDGLKRRLARPHGFSPPEDDDMFVRELLRVDGARDDQASALRRVLADLDRKRIDDGELMRSVSTADALLDTRGRLR
jgi:hypothetical protein